MALENIIITNISQDSIAQEFTQKAIDFLNKNYLGYEGKEKKIPDCDLVFSSSHFSGGEFDPQFRGEVEGKSVYLFGIPNLPAAFLKSLTPGELMARFLFASQAAYDNGAKTVKVIYPDMLFSRGDKTFSDFEPGTEAYEKNKGRGRTARAQAIAFKGAGIEEIITLDIHSKHVEDFYKDIYGYQPIHVINQNPLFAHYLVNDSSLKINDKGKELVIVCPDLGAQKKVRDFVSILKDSYGLTNIGVMYLKKIRRVPNNPDEVDISIDSLENIDTIQDKHIIIYDDIVDTAGTFSTACKHIRSKGICINGADDEPQLPKGIYGFLSHAVLAGMNYEGPMKKLVSSRADELILTNTHLFVEDNLIYPLKQNTSILRLAHVFAEAIYCRELDHDVNDIYRCDGKIDPERIARIYNVKRSSSHFLNQR